MADGRVECELSDGFGRGLATGPCGVPKSADADGLFDAGWGKRRKRQNMRDSDDVFVDAKRRRVYVGCGEGYLDAFEPDAGTFRRIAHLPTAPGARTALFVPELDRLFLAVRARDQEPAAIWAYRSGP
jgi:hypothetical protein